MPPRKRPALAAAAAIVTPLPPLPLSSSPFRPLPAAAPPADEDDEEEDDDDEAEEEAEEEEEEEEEGGEEEEEEEEQRAPQPRRTVLFRKRSSNANATVESPLDSYRVFLQNLHPHQVDWDNLRPGDARLESRFDGLGQFQQDVYYFILVGLLNAYVKGRIGVANFNDCDRQWVWNWPTWHRTIIRLSGSIEGGRVGGEGDCWFSTFSTGNGGMPKVAMRQGRYERRPDGNHAWRDIFTLYQHEGCPGRSKPWRFRDHRRPRHGHPAFRVARVRTPSSGRPSLPQSPPNMHQSCACRLGVRSKKQGREPGRQEQLGPLPTPREVHVGLRLSGGTHCQHRLG
ncbi:hypothetical protein HRR83_005872 [Exophiala dermatitidis]|uniref:Uncharacterized protein n=2 Tax=Exophiala dermatitidis TaxID=5970 RepID=H6BUJ4_EXODN|nr:uncharacterized protein HMPREF1120_03031 [Exophiala dermatitidis NIH/UT8656]KAJ4508780.1 hypothetical protein HRR73_007449 [Exophiala dermatitidis]EHY54869.1 hypothetical protein HMPREF1120_03031 [Exophiala dermatitidis NIH/UT8656]KAJ4513427.1 hypothetical protein HRR74_006241 [Exophiala dermatitidis]KAJ4538017.1 hypothetical protein HRR77_007059 [Exophiala dermatitidis]KAJ4539748.1 hypothetical protein HRR76_003186 [Exophiala dermatitidis]